MNAGEMSTVQQPTGPEAAPHFHHCATAVQEASVNEAHQPNMVTIQQRPGEQQMEGSDARRSCPAGMNQARLSGSNPAAAIPPSLPSDQDAIPSRLEQLMEQQNLLMQRQLQMSEEKVKHSETMKHPFVTQQKLLQTLDPWVRGVFKHWQREFRKKIEVYITQYELSAKYQEGTARNELLKPLLDEAQKPWTWTQFYRSVAKPIDGVDPSSATTSPLESVDAQSKPHDDLPSSEGVRPYDIDAAFAGLRSQHAWELQNFVTAHLKAGLDKIMDDLVLPNQVWKLQVELTAWVAENNGFYGPQSKERLELQARSFVELVYREEMLKAENRIKAGKVASRSLVSFVRIACVVLALLAATTMSHELLIRLFASLFALLCGIALLWEDLVMSFVRLLLGQSAERLRALGKVTDDVQNCPNFNIKIPLWG
jgi:hypothetical protein